MKRIRVRQPSPGMIIAIIALIAALGGTALAGGVLTTKKFKNQAVRGPLQYATTAVSLPTSGSAQKKVAASCPAGTRPLGGGVKIEPPNGNAYIDDAYLTATGYAGTVFNNSGISTTVTVVVACATVKTSVGAPPTS